MSRSKIFNFTQHHCLAAYLWSYIGIWIRGWCQGNPQINVDVSRMCSEKCQMCGFMFSLRLCFSKRFENNAKFTLQFCIAILSRSTKSIFKHISKLQIWTPMTQNCPAQSFQLNHNAQALLWAWANAALLYEPLSHGECGTWNGGSCRGPEVPS